MAKVPHYVACDLDGNVLQTRRDGFRGILPFTTEETGCGILLAEAVLDDEKKKITALLQSLNMLVQTEGKERSGPEYRGLLEQHGFSNVKIKLTGNLLDVVLCIKV